MARLLVLVVSFCLLYPTAARADYGFNCAGLLSLTDAERQWYLRGYFLALGQELSILEAQLSSPKPQGDALQSLLEGVRARRQLLSKAARDNLGFEKSLLSFCRAPDNGWVGMFEAIPGAMYDMKGGGASEFPMREETANEVSKQLH